MLIKQHFGSRKPAEKLPGDSVYKPRSFPLFCAQNYPLATYPNIPNFWPYLHFPYPTQRHVESRCCTRAELIKSIHTSIKRTLGAIGQGLRESRSQTWASFTVRKTR